MREIPDQKAQLDQLLTRYEADLVKWHRKYLILSDERDKLAAERDRLLDACRYARDTFAVYPWPYYSDVFSKLQAALAWDKNDLGNQ